MKRARWLTEYADRREGIMGYHRTKTKREATDLARLMVEDGRALWAAVVRVDPATWTSRTVRQFGTWPEFRQAKLGESLSTGKVDKPNVSL